MDPGPIDPASIAAEIEVRNLRLAREVEISDDLRFYLEQLAAQVVGLSERSASEVDPYLLLALQNALIGALLVLDSGDSVARREMRVRLEQMRSPAPEIW